MSDTKPPQAPLAAFDLARFVDERRNELRPPVGNARVFEDGDFIVMVVGGPNQRKDFHVDPGDELFHQLQGDMVLVVVEDGARREIAVGAGQMLLLPAGVPHSPRRPPNSVGLVVERRRRAGELDAFHWYCETCDAAVASVAFPLSDITTQIRDAIAALAADESARTCPRCGTILEL